MALCRPATSHYLLWASIYPNLCHNISSLCHNELINVTECRPCKYRYCSIKLWLILGINGNWIHFKCNETRVIPFSISTIFSSVSLGNGWVVTSASLQWRHNWCDGILNHQPHDSLLNRLLRHSSKKTSRYRVTGLCAGEFPAQMASNTDNVFIEWSHHIYLLTCVPVIIKLEKSSRM